MNTILEILLDAEEEKGIPVSTLFTMVQMEFPELDKGFFDLLVEKLCNKQRIVIYRDVVYLWKTLAIEDTPLYDELKNIYIRQARLYQDSMGDGIDPFAPFRDEEGKSFLNDKAVLGLRERMKREGVDFRGRKLV